MRRFASSVGVWLAVSATIACAADGGRTPKPVLQSAAAGTQCVEPTATMRRDHMKFLKHQRDDTVHGGVRGARHSLKGCVDCHASKTTNSVAKGDTDFCVACHSYAAVKIDCFECHTGKPHAVVQGRVP